MSCYLRHLKPVLGELGIEPKTKEERKQVDLAIRSMVGKREADKCGEVWQEVKVWLNDDVKKRSLLEKLKKLS